MRDVIKLIIAFLLLGCLFTTSHGYYQFVRITAFLGFITLAYLEYSSDEFLQMIFFAGCALLFNPVYKFHFIGTYWNIIDEILAVGLFMWVIIDIIVFFKKPKFTSNR